MKGLTLFLASSAYMLVSASQVNFHGASSRRLDVNSILQSRDDTQGSQLLLKRMPTKSGGSRGDAPGPSNPGPSRPRSRSDLSVNPGQIKTKPKKATDQTRSSLGSPRGSEGSGSSRRPVKYASSPRSTGSGGSHSAASESSASSGQLRRSQSLGTLSSLSAASSPGHGERGWIHDSNLAHSPRTPQSSLRSSTDDDRSFRSRQAYSPTSLRDSMLDSVGVPSPLGSSVTQPSVSGADSPPHAQSIQNLNLLQIHDSPSSLPRRRGMADPIRQSMRPTSAIHDQQGQQVPPESPVSRIGSVTGEPGSPQGASTDRGSSARGFVESFRQPRFPH